MLKQKIDNFARGLLKLLAFFIVAVLAIVAYMDAKGCGDDQACINRKAAEAHAKKLNSLQYDCAARWKIAKQHTLRDPDSLAFDYQAASVKVGDKTPWAIVVPYRARNGFGGLNLYQAACTFDPDTVEIIALIQ